MSKLTLLFLLAATPAAVAQDAPISTHDTPARPGETTILNTSIVRVDRPGRTITVRVDAGADGDVDRNRTRQLAVAPSAAPGLAMLKAGSEVLLTMRGDTVVASRCRREAGAADRRRRQHPGGGGRPPRAGLRARPRSLSRRQAGPARAARPRAASSS